MVDHLEANQFLHPQQFGFRSGYSTEIANCCFIENVKKSLDRGDVVGAVFLDLKKAFDTINHSLLLTKMSSFNFSTKAVQWFASYLQARVQCVKVNQEKSSLLNIKMGIPQGSVLGPLLFSLFINDLPLHCSGASFQLYADDAVLYAPAKSPELAADVLSACMADVGQWLNQNQLVLNFTKTVSMCFSIKKLDLNKRFKVNLQKEKIQSVIEFTYLGLVIDPQLNFTKHIKKISKTIQRNLNCFKLIRHYIPNQAALLYMHAMVFSHISYCMTVWGQAAPSATKHIGSLYNRAIKIMDKKPIRYHHCYILEKYKILSFESFSNLCFLKLIFKCINNLAPEPLSKFIEIQNNQRVTRTSTNHNCTIPYCRTSFAQTAFSVKSCRLWNALPSDIKAISDFKKFTSRIKLWLKTNQNCIHF